MGGKEQTLTDVIAMSENDTFDVVTDLTSLKKAMILKYTQYLFNQVQAHKMTIKQLSETFEKTTVNLLEQSVKAVVDPLRDKIDTFQASITNMSSAIQNLDTSPNQNMGEADPVVVKNSNRSVEPFSEHIEGFLDDAHVKRLQESIENMEFKPIGDGQREVAYFGDYKYTYTGGSHEPREMPQCIKDVVTKITERYPKNPIVTCVVSKYADGSNYCPQHSDDEKSIDPTSDILTLSLGENRPMEFTEIRNASCKTEILLTHNSLLVCSRLSQSYWRHGIPVVEHSGPRYSLTFRAIQPFNLNSTVIYGDSNTKYLEFGDGEGRFGKWMPGERIKTQGVRDLPPIEHIAPYQNIVIHTGVNDINRHNRLSTCEYIRALEHKCTEIHNVYPKTRVILSPLLPTKLPSLNQQIWKVNDAIISLSKRHHNIIYMDNSIFARGNDCLKPEYGRFHNPDDAIHLGKMGIRMFAESIKSYVVRKNPSITKSLNYDSALNYGSRY